MASKTARSVISDALLDLGVIADEESMSAAQGVYGLRKLNELLHGFESEGIRYTHTDLASLDTTVNIPDGQLRNLGWLLQRDIASAYGAAFSAEDQMEIDRARSALQAFYYMPVEAAPDLALRPRVYGRFNFSRG